ncbi:MAG: ABC transporter substrate-binding protein [Conexibacteraceae bacterium]|nr:ABC transporter substrate-binding protein [Conexibacteraceae bacterium]
MFIRNRRALALSGVTAAAAAAAVGISSVGTAGAATNWSTATSATAGGGLAALVSAAKAEGKLNVITLPSNWANYGTIMKQFSKQYGIKITDAIPSGSSAQEIEAIEHDKGRSDAPDVVDIGQSFTAPQYQKLFADYKVSTWKSIPATNKAANGSYVNDYGGYVSFGCFKKLVKHCPTSWSQLTNKAYAKDITLNGIPGQAGAATGAVWAAALNNGGSLNNVTPGLNFFAKLSKDGNFNNNDCDSSAEIEAGACPIVINWDFLNIAGAWGLPASQWTVNVPKGTPFAEYYNQAISASAPDPAAARLWEEFLYSAQGQNDFLKGHARPVELAAMTANHTIDTAALKQLPKTSGTVKQMPTVAQANAAATVLATKWGSSIL